MVERTKPTPRFRLSTCPRFPAWPSSSSLRRVGVGADRSSTSDEPAVCVLIAAVAATDNPGVLCFVSRLTGAGNNDDDDDDDAGGKDLRDVVASRDQSTLPVCG